MVQGKNSLKFFMAAALGTMASAALPLHAQLGPGCEYENISNWWQAVQQNQCAF